MVVAAVSFIGMCVFLTVGIDLGRWLERKILSDELAKGECRICGQTYPVQVSESARSAEGE
jgi:uncharacterized protein YneF (UPF0154 family)